MIPAEEDDFPPSVATISWKCFVLVTGGPVFGCAILAVCPVVRPIAPYHNQL